MSFVTIHNITKSFGNQVVLDEISLTIEEGELITLLGQSGCGKSTLLRSIAGLTEMEDGIIAVDGTDITKTASRDREVGMVFQSYALFPNMSVFDNIAFGLKMKKVSKSTIKTKVQDIIEMMNLNGKEDAFPNQLSGGQQQRVALARALVMEPKVLLLDEPLSALDAKIRKNLQAQLKRIQKELKITTIFVTHDQEEAMILSDRIFVMEKGRIVQQGAPADIYTKPANEFVARFIGNYNVFSMEQFHSLVPHESLTGTDVAIRPEIMKLRAAGIGEAGSDENVWSIPGVITDISMTGNILRYAVEANGMVFMVDDLHNKNLILQRHTAVNIMIPKDECIVFS